LPTICAAPATGATAHQKLSWKLPKGGVTRLRLLLAPFRTRPAHIVRLGAIGLLFVNHDCGPRSAHQSLPYPHSPGSQNGTYA
jgi:hypothetical protein